jgi:hypothetical protein
MASDDLFELPLPFALKIKIGSERPIVLTLRGHGRRPCACGNRALGSRYSAGTKWVDELIIYFTHDCPIDYMLPGIPRTGRKVALPHVVVMKFKGDNSPTSISTGIKLVCSLRSVFSTQANCPSPEPSKPRHSLKNRGGSERKRDRPEPSDLPIQAGAALFRANTGHTVAIFRQIRQRRASRQS